MEKKFQRYNILTTWVYSSSYVNVDPLCNGWMAINKGTDVVMVNGVPLNPPPVPTASGESTGATGNYGEVYVGTIDIRFATMTGPKVLIVQKVYVVQ